MLSTINKSDLVRENSSSSVGMDVFATLFVVFVVVTLIAALSIGKYTIPENARYLRVVIETDAPLQGNDFPFGFTLLNEQGNAILRFSPTDNKITTKLFSSYIKESQELSGNKGFTVFIKNLPEGIYSLQPYSANSQHAEAYLNRSLSLWIMHPLMTRESKLEFQFNGSPLTKDKSLSFELRYSNE